MSESERERERGGGVRHTCVVRGRWTPSANHNITTSLHDTVVLYYTTTHHSAPQSALAILIITDDVKVTKPTPLLFSHLPISGMPLLRLLRMCG